MGQINRRRFVMSALASGVTLPTAMSLASKAEGATPKKGGHLRLATPDRMQFEALLTFATASTLVERDARGGIVGDLARDFSYEEGGRVWVFDLHRDVVFSDGTLLEARHVVESLLPLIGTADHAVTGLKATAPDQVRFTLERPDFTFPARLTEPDLAVRRRGADGQMVGTGGYVPTAEDDGTITLVRRQEHWRAERAHFDSVALSHQPSLTALQSDMMAGRLDYAAGILPETVAFLAHLPEVTLTSYGATRALVVRAASGELDDKAAGALAAMRSDLDRGAFVDRALLGHGIAGDDAPRPPTDPRMRIENRRHAPPEGPIPVLSETTESWVPHLTDMARRLGVDLATGHSPRDRAALRALSLSATDIAKWTHATGEQTLSALLPFALEGDFEAARLTAKACEDAAMRAEAMETLCQTVARSGTLFIPAWANDLAAHSTRLAHPADLIPHLPNDGHRLIERWWYS